MRRDEEEDKRVEEEDKRVEEEDKRTRGSRVKTHCILRLRYVFYTSFLLFLLY